MIQPVPTGWLHHGGSGLDFLVDGFLSSEKMVEMQNISIYGYCEWLPICSLDTLQDLLQGILIWFWHIMCI